MNVKTASQVGIGDVVRFPDSHYYKVTGTMFGMIPTNRVLISKYGLMSLDRDTIVRVRSTKKMEKVAA